MTLRFKISLFLVGLLTIYLKGLSQDSTFKFSLDSTLFSIVNISSGFSFKYEPEFNFIYHNPDNKAYQRYKTDKYLIEQLPTEKNHERYFELAEALWNINKKSFAEKMFLNIVNSKIKAYNITEYHSSGTLYGYGSFTSNYKNYACVYLTKIYIEKKKFQTALNFLDQAVKKYKVYYTCGVGHNRQQNEYDFLYAACYEGLGYNEKNIDNLLPSFFDWDNKILTKAVQKLYSQKEIKANLKLAEKSISYVGDSEPSEAYIKSNYGAEDEKTDTIRYYGGIGSIILFGKKIDLPSPPLLKDGEKLTREYYVNIFKESSFYDSLSDKKKMNRTTKRIKVRRNGS
jgi:hypothetical protein